MLPDSKYLIKVIKRNNKNDQYDNFSAIMKCKQICVKILQNLQIDFPDFYLMDTDTFTHIPYLGYLSENPNLSKETLFYVLHDMNQISNIDVIFKYIKNKKLYTLIQDLMNDKCLHKALKNIYIVEPLVPYLTDEPRIIMFLTYKFHITRVLESLKPMEFDITDNILKCFIEQEYCSEHLIEFLNYKKFDFHRFSHKDIFKCLIKFCNNSEFFLYIIEFITLTKEQVTKFIKNKATDHYKSCLKLLSKYDYKFSKYIYYILCLHEELTYADFANTIKVMPEPNLYIIYRLIKSKFPETIIFDLMQKILMQITNLLYMDIDFKYKKYMIQNSATLPCFNPEMLQNTDCAEDHTDNVWIIQQFAHNISSFKHIPESLQNYAIFSFRMQKYSDIDNMNYIRYCNNELVINKKNIVYVSESYKQILICLKSVKKIIPWDLWFYIIKFTM